jgi:hypothetical protein
VHLKPASGIILSAVAFLGHFQDSCQSAGLCLDNSGGGTPADITWAPRESNGQANGLVGVSDRVSNLANWSCIGLIIGGFFRAYVGTAIDLYRAASVVVSGGTNVRAWNYYGWYASDAGSLGYDAGMRIGGTCESVLVQGLFGGGSAGAGLYASIGYYDEIAVRYSVSGNPSNVTLNLGLGVGTSQSASL